MIQLRFDNLPSFATSPVICRLTSDVDAALRELPRVYTRSVAALRFRQQIGGTDGVSESHVAIMQVAYLRAALMEYAAMEEVLADDLAARGRGESPLRILDTRNALLVILRELRHLQLHLVNTTFRREVKPAVLRSGDREIETEVEVKTVPWADLQELKNLRNAKNFRGEDLDAAIHWFSDAQAAWGVADVLQAGVQLYAEYLVNTYGLGTGD